MHELNTFLYADQTQAYVSLGFRWCEPASLVHNEKTKVMTPPCYFHPGFTGAGVLGDIPKSFLGDAVKRERHLTGHVTHFTRCGKTNMNVLVPAKINAVTA
jgi:hypothetical protein